MRVKISTMLMVLFVACGTMSCKKDSSSNSGIRLEGIKFQEMLLILYVGDTHATTLVTTPDGANLPTCTYTSSDNSVATVNKTSGVITGVTAGAANIKATTTDGKFSAECIVTVLAGGGSGSESPACAKPL